jgi:hypothetical protein
VKNGDLHNTTSKAWPSDPEHPTGLADKKLLVNILRPPTVAAKRGGKCKPVQKRGISRVAAMTSTSAGEGFAQGSVANFSGRERGPAVIEDMRAKEVVLMWDIFSFLYIFRFRF